MRNEKQILILLLTFTISSSVFAAAKYPLHDVGAKGSEINGNSQGFLSGTPLHSIVFCNRFQCIQDLLKSGNNINAQDIHGDTPLHYAALFGHFECVKELIKWGAEISIKNEDGQTAKNIAQEENHEEIEAYLQAIEDQPEIKEPENEEEQ